MAFKARPALLAAVAEVKFSHIVSVSCCSATLTGGMVVRGKNLELTRCLQACKILDLLDLQHLGLCHCHALALYSQLLCAGRAVVMARLAPPALSALQQGIESWYVLGLCPSTSLLPLLLQALPPSRCST